MAIYYYDGSNGTDFGFFDQSKGGLPPLISETPNISLAKQMNIAYSNKECKKVNKVLHEWTNFVHGELFDSEKNQPGKVKMLEK